MKQKDDSLAQLSAWIGGMQASCGTHWDRLPEIYLYMDQVLTFMDGQLRQFGRTAEGPLVTSSMVNNYVKDGVLPRPQKKKYSREHLARLTIICLLKQVLAIQDIHTLLDLLLKEQPIDQLYDGYCQEQSREMEAVGSRVSAAAEEGAQGLTRLALQLSAQANARRTAAECILAALRTEPSAAEKPAEQKKAPAGSDA